MNLKLSFIIYLSIIICTVSCSSGSKNSVQQIEKISGASHQDSLVGGNWLIGTQFSDGMAVMCNVCPHIEFKQGGFAKIVKADNSFEYVRWHIKHDQVIVMTRNSTFADSTYNLSLQKEKDLTYLILKSRDDQSQYTLVK